jgi:hypothetical protein
MKKNKNTLRIAIFCSLIAAVVYGVFFLVIGSIPVIKQITLLQAPWENILGPKFNIVVLPFSISRAWDILFVSFFAALVTKLWKYYRQQGVIEELFYGCGLLFSLVLGIALSSAFCIGYGYVCAMEFGIALSLIISLIGWSAKAGLAVSASFSLGLCLAYGTSTSLVLTFVAVLPTFALISVTTYLLSSFIFSLTGLIKTIINQTTIQKLFVWLQGA